MAVKIFPQGTPMEEIAKFLEEQMNAANDPLPIQYGCECNRGCNAHGEEHPAEKAPVVYVVERKGETLKVCTRCYLPGVDTIKEFLVDRVRTPDPDVIYNYDKLGFLVLTQQLQELEEEFANARKH